MAVGTADRRLNQTHPANHPRVDSLPGGFMNGPLLIFSDLDGTLLDHHTYSCQGAEQSLGRIHELGIPLILTSSKTASEILALQATLGLREAFIPENGGGIFVPDNHPLADRVPMQRWGDGFGIRFGCSYTEIRRVFESIRDDYGLRGFGDMSVDQISAATGLPHEQACLAAQRDFSEPFLFLGDVKLDALRARVWQHGMTVTRGGRFHHLMSANQDKGKAVSEVTRLYRTIGFEDVVTIGLGDAENDLPFLKIVDIPILIPHANGDPPVLQIAGLRRARLPGSRGWGVVINSLLDEFCTSSP